MSSRSYYPGFLAALFLVVLRVAIGWHFMNEGIWKVQSWRRGDKPFTADGYLRNATGPFASYFRAMVPDVNGLETLDPPRLKAAWRADVDRIASHYGFNDGQRTKAAEALKDSEAFADLWFQDRENREKREKYYHDLGAVQKVEQNPGAMANEREWAWGQRKTLASERKDVTKELDTRAATLREVVTKLATPEQQQSAGPYAPAWTQLDWSDTFTAYSLIAIGFCLMFGLLTRFAALGGAAFLTLIYLCMPPWPGLPANPLAEGHFLYIDKNAVELLACLALACLPTGQWVGADAVLFGWLRRRREFEAGRELVETEPLRGSGRRVQSVS